MSEWKKKREVMCSYGDLATSYDALYEEEQNAKMRMILSKLQFKENSLVLDMGCGTGLLFEHVGESVRLLVGLDVSLGILKEAKKRVRQSPTVALVCADADFTPFPDEVFDGALAVTLLQNMPNPCLTLQEMKRVSKQHSIIAVTGLRKKFSKNAFIRLIAEAGLRVTAIKTASQSKSYVAVCNL